MMHQHNHHHQHSDILRSEEDFLHSDLHAWLNSPVAVESYGSVGEHFKHQAHRRLLIAIDAQQARLLDLIRGVSTAAAADIRLRLALVVVVDRVVITCGHDGAKSRCTATRRYVKITSWIQWNTVAITTTRRMMHLVRWLWCNCIGWRRHRIVTRIPANMAWCGKLLCVLRNRTRHHHQISCAARAQWFQFDSLQTKARVNLCTICDDHVARGREFFLVYLSCRSARACFF